MKVVVLGSTGMLGSMVVWYLSQHFEVVATVRNKDYKAPEGVEVRYYDASERGNDDLAGAIRECDWIVNAIGSIPQKGEGGVINKATNALFPALLQLVAGVQGSQVIQIATDCVYLGDKGGYLEYSGLDAVDDYGISKKQGEVVSEYLHHIRCSIVGPELCGSHSLLGWFLSQPEKAIIDGYTNHIWNGVTSLHFAKVCRGIINHDLKLRHMQHLVPADSISKYELLGLFAEEFGREDIAIKPVEAPDSIDRTLSTDEPTLNRYLWRLAGYNPPPTIEKMIEELAGVMKR